MFSKNDQVTSSVMVSYIREKLGTNKKHMSASERNLLCASNMNTILLQYGYEGLALAVTVLLDEKI